MCDVGKLRLYAQPFSLYHLFVNFIYLLSIYKLSIKILPFYIGLFATSDDN